MAAYIRSSASPQRSDLPGRKTLRTQVELAQQQLRSWQEQLAQDAQQYEAHTGNAESAPSISIGSRNAIRGAILTDLCRMLDEVHDMVAMTSHPSLKDQAEEQSSRYHEMSMIQ
jgi:hypothetical protein